MLRAVRPLPSDAKTRKPPEIFRPSATHTSAFAADSEVDVKGKTLRVRADPARLKRLLDTRRGGT